MQRVRLFGLDFVSEVTIDELAAELFTAGKGQQSAWKTLVTPNVDHLVHYRRSSPTQRQVAENAQFVLPDGAPIVWASRLLRKPLSRRLAGSELFNAWWPLVRDEARHAASMNERGTLYDPRYHN